jgi:flagellar L-ring protein precursor FlgH
MPGLSMKMKSKWNFNRGAIMNNRQTFSAILLLLFCTGCVTAGPRQDSQSGQPLPDRFSLPTATHAIPAATAGAIYSPASKNLYQDSRARNIGDIVMVKIVETSSGDKTVETTTSRESTLTGGISSLFGYEKLFAGKNGAHTPSPTSMSATLAKDFTGTGETNRESTVTATISARVVDKSMDGNLLIQGYREIRVNNETQHIILSGIVRPEDISTDNSVLSSYIADARIEYGGTGTLSNKQQPGWFANLVDVVWPF